MAAGVSFRVDSAANKRGAQTNNASVLVRLQTPFAHIQIRSRHETEDGPQRQRHFQHMHGFSGRTASFEELAVEFHARWRRLEQLDPKARAGRQRLHALPVDADKSRHAENIELYLAEIIPLEKETACGK